MNERYLFRGKRIDNGEWVQGEAYLTDTDAFIITDLSTYADGFMQAFGVPVDPATAGQCTGLRDKNGTLIFEGDILRRPIGEREKEDEKSYVGFEVFFHDNDCCDEHIGYQFRQRFYGNICGSINIFTKFTPKYTAKMVIVDNIHNKEAAQ